MYIAVLLGAGLEAREAGFLVLPYFIGTSLYVPIHYRVSYGKVIFYFNCQTKVEPQYQKPSLKKLGQQVPFFGSI